MRPNARVRLSVLVVAGCLAATGIARAAEPAADHKIERLTYALQFGGLHVADVLLSLDETAAGYRTAMRMRSRGILAVFKTFSADLTGEGAFSRSAAGIVSAAPNAFERAWAAGEVSSLLHIDFDPATRLASAQERLYNPVTGQDLKREDLPWNRRHIGLKPVPAELRTQVLDPIAAFVAAREMIRGHAGPTSFSVPIYDGNRRYNVVGKTAAARDMTINDVTRPLISVSGKIEPVFGFDPELVDRVHEGDGRILFTADDRFIPVQIMVGNSLGVGVMNLTADCRTDTAPCDAFEQEQEQAKE